MVTNPNSKVFVVSIPRGIKLSGVNSYIYDQFVARNLQPIKFLGSFYDPVSGDETYKYEVEDMNLLKSYTRKDKFSALWDISDTLINPITEKKKPKVKKTKVKETKVTPIEVNFDMITYNDPSFYIPEEWTKLLSNIPGAYIAGGSIRDLELGATVKDIDVFVNVEDKDQFADKINGLQANLQLDPNKMIRYDGDYQDKKTGENLDGLDNEVGLVVKIKTDNYSYDIIGRRGIDSLDKVVAQFDLGICQIGYDGRSIQCSENYIRDKSCKTITILKPMRYGTKGWEHMERVCQKYKNYRLV